MIQDGHAGKGWKGTLKGGEGHLLALRLWQVLVLLRVLALKAAPGDLDSLEAAAVAGAAALGQRLLAAALKTGAAQEVGPRVVILPDLRPGAELSGLCS